MKYVVRGTSDFYFTEIGKVGVALFVGGMALCGILSWVYFNGLMDNAAARLSYQIKDVTWAGVVAGICSLAALVGFVMLIVGRTQVHDITVQEQPE